jgi:hypothetical protein
MRERGESGLKGENMVDDDSLTDESCMGVVLLDDLLIQFIIYLKVKI